MTHITEFHRRAGAKGPSHFYIVQLVWTPKIYPTKAVMHMAIVPQKQIRAIAILISDPPIFAATAPDMAKKQ